MTNAESMMLAICFTAVMGAFIGNMIMQIRENDEIVWENLLLTSSQLFPPKK